MQDLKLWLVMLGLAATGWCAMASAHPTTYVGDVERTVDRHLTSLARRVAVLERELGLDTHEIPYAVPRDVVLVARFEAAIDGTAVPSLSRTYLVPPPVDEDDPHEGTIIVTLRAPPLEPDEPAVWNLRFEQPGLGASFSSLASPYDPRTAGGVSSSGIAEGQSVIDLGRDYDVWQRRVSPVAGPSPGLPGEFIVRLMLRAEPVAATFPRGRVWRVGDPGSPSWPE